MKIAIFSDCHGDLPNIDKDIKTVFICGDICPTKNHSRKYQAAWIDSFFIPWIKAHEFNKVILVPGNHDFIFESASNSYLSALRIETMGVLEVLINESITIANENGDTFKIFGTPYCKMFGNWAFMREDDRLRELYSKIPENLDILLCHDAPDLNGQGLITEGWNYGINAGNPVLAEAVINKKPKRLFHGHIHSSPKDNEYDGIHMNNVSVKNEKYQSVYPITIIEL